LVIVGLFLGHSFYSLLGDYFIIDDARTNEIDGTGG